MASSKRSSAATCGNCLPGRLLSCGTCWTCLPEVSGQAKVRTSGCVSILISSLLRQNLGACAHDTYRTNVRLTSALPASTGAGSQPVAGSSVSPSGAGARVNHDTAGRDTGGHCSNAHDIACTCAHVALSALTAASRTAGSPESTSQAATRAISPLQSAVLSCSWRAQWGETLSISSAR